MQRTTRGAAPTRNGPTRHGPTPDPASGGRPGTPSVAGASRARRQPPELRSRAWASSRLAIAAVVIVPFVGFIAAVGYAWARGGISLLDVGLFAAFYLLTGFGITVGFHRLFTHQSFRAVPWLRATLGVLGCMAVQGPIVNWVADHRKHHRFSDHEGDPHSPNLLDDHGLFGTLGGLWHAHVGWLFAAGRSEAETYAPDLLKDPVITFIDKHYALWMLASFLLPGVIAFALTGGSVAAGIGAFLFAGTARVFLLHHATWSVNSVCHTFGERAFETKDRSRNHPLVGWLGLGEGWHNNHHAFPASARHGLDEGQFDLTWQVIRLFVRLGWVHDVRLPLPARVAEARRG
jgi:stearoyl-CoA desaturase (Delta-9 desaturase)